MEAQKDSYHCPWLQWAALFHNPGTRGTRKEVKRKFQILCNTKHQIKIWALNWKVNCMKSSATFSLCTLPHSTPQATFFFLLSLPKTGRTSTRGRAKVNKPCKFWCAPSQLTNMIHKDLTKYQSCKKNKALYMNRLLGCQEWCWVKAQEKKGRAGFLLKYSFYCI